jgi:hypothetical protein
LSEDLLPQIAIGPSRYSGADTQLDKKLVVANLFDLLRFRQDKLRRLSSRQAFTRALKTKSADLRYKVSASIWKLD